VLRQTPPGGTDKAVQQQSVSERKFEASVHDKKFESNTNEEPAQIQSSEVEKQIIAKNQALAFERKSRGQ